MAKIVDLTTHRQTREDAFITYLQEQIVAKVCADLDSEWFGAGMERRIDRFLRRTETLDESDWAFLHMCGYCLGPNGYPRVDACPYSHDAWVNPRTGKTLAEER